MELGGRERVRARPAFGSCRWPARVPLKLDAAPIALAFQRAVLGLASIRRVYAAIRRQPFQCNHRTFNRPFDFGRAGLAGNLIVGDLQAHSVGMSFIRE